MENNKIIFSNKDLIEKFTHSSGKGGQNVNKVATCVYLKHIPTGIEVKCQIYRTQAENRMYARKLLTEKILNLRKEIENKLRNEFEKDRRTKRPKPKSLKEEILKNKKFRSEIKSLRKKVLY
jgi:protein subunit release factor B